MFNVTVLLRSASSRLRSLYFFNSRFICKSNLPSSVEDIKFCRTVFTCSDVDSCSSVDELSITSINLRAKIALALIYIHLSQILRFLPVHILSGDAERMSNIHDYDQFIRDMTHELHTCFVHRCSPRSVPPNWH